MKRCIILWAVFASLLSLVFWVESGVLFHRYLSGEIEFFRPDLSKIVAGLLLGGVLAVLPTFLIELARQMDQDGNQGSFQQTKKGSRNRFRSPRTTTIEKRDAERPTALADRTDPYGTDGPLKKMFQGLMICLAGFFVISGLAALWEYRNGGHPIAILTVVVIVFVLCRYIWRESTKAHEKSSTS